MGANELNIVGDFSSPWRTLKEKYRERLRWQPDTGDFLDIVTRGGGGNGTIAGDVFKLIATILSRPRNTISRLNIFTHADSASIGLSGSVIVKPGGITTSIGISHGTNQEITLDMLEKLALTPSFSPTKKGQVGKPRKGKSKVPTLEDVHARFQDRAEIVIYACKTAVDKHLLQALADTFGVTVVGFTDLIEYCLSSKDGEQIELKIGIGVSDPNKCAANTVFDFHQLTAKGTSFKASTPGPQTDNE